MKKLGAIKGAHSSRVELVEVEGRKYILKTSSVEEITAEKFYYDELVKKGFPTLTTLESNEIAENQILIEYIDGSPTLDASRDPEMYKKWGVLVRQTHSITFDSSFYFDKSGNRQDLAWDVFLRREIELIKAKNNLPEGLFQHAIDVLSVLPETQALFSLLHCDPHTNNVLLKEGNPYLFDIGADMSAGDIFYDLAIVVMSLPNDLYIYTSDSEYASDTLLRDSFIEGYGLDFIAENRKVLDWYVLLRSMQRHPNHFEPYLENIISTILE